MFKTTYTKQQLLNCKKINMIKEFYIEGEQFNKLQLELSAFYNLDINYSNPFDDQSIRDGIPIKISTVAGLKPAT